MSEEFKYSYLDLCVIPELRNWVISGDPAVLFSEDLGTILWSNAAGAEFFGCETIGDFLVSRPSPSQPFIRQLGDAKPQIIGDEVLHRGFRIVRGIRSELIDCTFQRVLLPSGTKTYLLIASRENHTPRLQEHQLARQVADSLIGFAHAAAVIDDKGLPLAATESFSDADISADTLGDLVDKLIYETDRLIKAPLSGADGVSFAAGIARISDSPGRNLLVLAQPMESTLQSAMPEMLQDDDTEEESLKEIEDDTDNIAEITEPEEDEVSDDGEISLATIRSRVEALRSETMDEEDTVAATEEHYDEPDTDDVFAPSDFYEEPRLRVVANQTIAEEADLEPDEAPEIDQPSEDADYPHTPQLVSNDDEKSPPETKNEIRIQMRRWRPAEPESPFQRQMKIPEPHHSTEADESTAHSEPASSETDEIEADREEEAQIRPAKDLSFMEEDLDDDLIGEDNGDAENVDEIDYDDDDDDEDDDDTDYGGEDDDDDRESFDDQTEVEPFAEIEPEAPPVLALETNTEELQDHQISPEFTFVETEEAVRFAWTTDADQVFQSVSPELAATVGPNASDIIGRKWSDVAAVFGFDDSGTISRLLSKKDTWSGKTVLWPIQSTDLQVPIDLAALPAFGTDREFEGFRGFGIIRTADTILDPDATGLALKPIEPPADRDALTEENQEDFPIRQQLDDDTEVEANNVISLRPAKSPPDNDNLTSKENQVFTEIGERLRQTADSEWQVGAQATDPALDDEDQETAEEVDNAQPALATQQVAQETETDEENFDLSENKDYKHLVNTQILDEIPIPVLVFRTDETLFANASLLQVSEYPSLEKLAIAGGIDALLDVEEQETIAEGAVHQLRKRNGGTVPVNPILKSVPWDGQKALMVTFQPSHEPEDHEDEKIALDIALISEMQNILDTATDGIIVMNKDGRIESINGSAEALFGVPQAEVIDADITSLFALESYANLTEYIKSINTEGLSSVINDGREVIGKEAKGGLIPMFVTIGKMGQSGKLCLVVRDMTSWKKAEEDLVTARRYAEDASDQKSDFLARVSHEIRTPLNAIIGFSDVMIEERFGPIDNERYREYLRDINRSGIHVLDLVNDLLDLSKIESGKIELSFEAVDLNQIVSETVALMQPQANSNQIIIRTSLSRVVPKVVADARSMRQIIMNLVSNAIKFSQPNGQVIVSTVYEGNGEVALRIRDTGYGMSEEELEDAMKPFHQIPGVSEKAGKGTGLGLPLTKALVEANRAHFDLESEKNEGTIAHVQFPTQRVLAD